MVFIGNFSLSPSLFGLRYSEQLNGIGSSADCSGVLPQLSTGQRSVPGWHGALKVKMSHTGLHHISGHWIVLLLAHEGEL